MVSSDEARINGTNYATKRAKLIVLAVVITFVVAAFCDKLFSTIISFGDTIAVVFRIFRVFAEDEDFHGCEIVGFETTKLECLEASRKLTSILQA